MAYSFPLNAHGKRFKKAGVSVATDVSAGRVTPANDEWAVALLTPADRGVPGFRVDDAGKALPLTSFRQAQEYWGGSGDALELTRLIFNPSVRGDDIRGPERVFAVRVGSPTQSTLGLDRDADATEAITLTSRDYGTHVNEIEVKVEKTGERHTLTFRKGNVVIATPSLGPQFQIIYHGAGTAATLTITKTGGVAVSLATAITGAAADNLLIDLTQFTTISALAAHLNSLDNYACVLDADGQGDLSPSRLDAESATSLYTFALDEVPSLIEADGITFVSAIPASVKIGDFVRDVPTASWKQIVNIVGKKVFVNEALTPNATPTLAAAINVGVTTSAILYAIANNLNDENPFVTAAVIEAANDGSGLEALSFTKMTGGTNPAATVQDWLDAQAEVEKKLRGQGVVMMLNTTDRVIHKSFADFAEDMYSSDKGIFPFWCGAARAESKSSILARSPFVGSRFARIVGMGATILDVNGANLDVSPVFMAAIGAGQQAGSGLTEPLTFNRVPVVALERDDDDEDIRDYIAAGIVTLENDPDKGVVFQIAVTASQDFNSLTDRVFLDHQRNTTERALRAELKRLYLGKALVKGVQGDIRDTTRSVLEAFLDRGGTDTGFIQRIGSIVVEGTGDGRVFVTYEVDFTDEADHIIVKGFARVATFVNLGTEAAA